MRADMDEMRAFYETLKSVYEPSRQIQVPPRTEVLFEGQRNRPSALVRAFRRPLKRQTHGAGIFTGQDFLMDVKLELDNPPTREEVRKATMQLKVGKSPGIDGIPAEVYHYGGEGVLNKLQDLFTNCWEKGTLLQDLRNCLLYTSPSPRDDY